MTDIWFTSDHHFYHKNIIKYCNRPFKTLEEMHDICIYLWNRSVRQTDIVYYVGDFSLSTQAVTEITPKLNGQKILLWGNHDKVHPIRSKKEHQKWLEIYKKAGWEDLGAELLVNLGGKNLKVTHLPYAEEQNVKWSDWRPQIEKEDMLICGHVHEKWKRKIVRGVPMVNVGVDQWRFEPVNLEQLKGEFEC